LFFRVGSDTNSFNFTLSQYMVLMISQISITQLLKARPTQGPRGPSKGFRP